MNRKYRVLITLIIAVLTISCVHDEKVNQSNTRSVEDKFDFALLQINEGNYEEGKSLLLEIQGVIDANSPIATSVKDSLAFCYYKLLNYEEAIALYATRVFTNNIALEEITQERYLDAIYQSQDYEQCIEVSHEYLSHFSDSKIKLKSFDYIVISSIELGNYEEALTYNEKMITLEPENVNHKIATAYIYQYLYDYDYAKSYLGELKKLYPENETIIRLTSEN
jgi:tetratricopeptide (TPR) repeat protein